MICTTTTTTTTPGSHVRWAPPAHDQPSELSDASVGVVGDLSFQSQEIYLYTYRDGIAFLPILLLYAQVFKRRGCENPDQKCMQSVRHHPQGCFRECSFN